jgi:hypothetical protein
MRYVPDLKTVFFNNRLRDPATGEWKRIDGKGGPVYRTACGGDYDPNTRRLLIYQGGSNVYALPIDTKEWKQVSTGGPAGYGYGFDYDPVAKEFIIHSWEDKLLKQAWGFDTAKDQWTRMPDPQGDIPVQGAYAIRWYDSAHNVHVIYNCSDIWVYRNKRAAR